VSDCHVHNLHGLKQFAKCTLWYVAFSWHVSCCLANCSWLVFISSQSLAPPKLWPNGAIQIYNNNYYYYYYYYSCFLTGVIRYIGHVDFAEGLWLGVELKTPKGKHDGYVQGRRYFTCRPHHGLLVRPSRISVRGINGAQLRVDWYELFLAVLAFLHSASVNWISQTISV